MSTSKKALAIAEKHHRGQTRTTERFSVFTGNGVEVSEKTTEPFILHPMRVALSVVERVAQEQLQVERVTQVALLHDVIEDTKLTLDDLRSAGFSDGVLNDIELLTRYHFGASAGEESYADYIERVSEGPLTAVIVKIADLLDNLDGYTIDGVFADVPLVKRYRKALAQLGWAGREAQL